MLKIKGSRYGLKGYQLKNIIEQYNEQNDNIIKGYKSKTIMILDEIIRNNKIDPFDTNKYSIILNNPTKPVDIIKKAGINRYDEPSQKAYLNILNKNERYKNPTHALNIYTNKEGKQEYLTPLEHQKKFILQFIYSTLRGSVVFHGVGSGKTLTAVISSYYYLKLYPNNKVIIISPSALLFNFVAGMEQYGLDKNDNRYSFYTYEKYVRNPQMGNNALVIIDEAHNLRSEMNIFSIKDPETKNVIEESTNKNMRGYKIMKYGSEKCHKILLLTGTAFVNSLADIENLLAFVDNRRPISHSNYASVLEDVENIKDYFDYKISYYKSSDTSEFFPKRIEDFHPVYMTEEEEEKYKTIKSQGIPNSLSAMPNAFYIAERYASNMIDTTSNPKLDYIVKLLKERPNQKFIIYSGLTEYGTNNIESRLSKELIQVVKITGKQNTQQKEESKLYFNYFNFKNDKFFNRETLEVRYHKYINDKYRVLVISRAGAEGVDTINCQNIILYDSQWNDALSEQIIARAIRFKSHYGLPEKERYVNVIRPVMCYKSDENIVKLIKEKKMDYSKLYLQIKNETAQELKLMKVEDQRYLPTLKEIKLLKIGNKIFIPQETQYKTYKGMWGRPRQIVQDGNDGWDKYNAISDKEKRKNWRIKQYYIWHTQMKEGIKSNDDELRTTNNHAVDLWLYIICKSKQEKIDDFISYFGQGIKLYEDYESRLMKLILLKQQRIGRVLTEEEKILLYSTEHKEEYNAVLKYGDSKMYIRNNDRTTNNQLQQFYTNSVLATFIYQYSSLSENKNKNITILEPTAGQGDLIKPLIKENSNINVTMVEIDPKNRKTLNEMIKQSPLILKMAIQNNFLVYQSSERYDYVFMNPPFHLRKSEDRNLIRDTFDYDFIKRAFSFLKVGGELMAITGNGWRSNDDFNKWVKMKNKTFVTESRNKEKFSKIKIDITVMKIKKIDTSEDEELMFHKYYQQSGNGKLILENKINPSVVMNNKLTSQEIKQELKPYKRSEVEELEALEKEFEALIK